ncbi:phosphatidate cytidylyltransferase [[Clostridium] sordellii]|uniref:Phosphatidate cytidylyltransferase n=1 Tax=Paraclostridium sordellii TaxID=1505 RepID=A0ABM9RQZ8_PARSO|nr:phosphatidate cytidylyltransferase [Paeniclostridium sordellii]EPZ56473.1 cytidylyltransferase family protein [[Clostridium] sordellii ATCC 9714] [Paeniclostridium sordellii ATCC 9714]CEJ74474.1 Phosphatidate cytidylyltransferase CdsA [[Clostridium] sordellii] [Paeniclostridium sordellii]CEN70014.1 phosphatidate cytidylyltransferase [[Clostridium] sordellii] [Paeniclostridium sordellii]CEN73337.1 phosphatidate cytidylyltransferase [[Clostridium] sordellii] [Paeniclostridium sordellii]CEO293
MVVRIIAALALIPLLLFVIYGGLPLYIAEAIIGIIALDEFYKAFKSKSIQPISILGYVFAIYLSMRHVLNLNSEYTYILVFTLFLIGIIYMLTNKKNILDFSITFIGMFYIPIFLDFIVLTINNFDLGNIYVWLIFIVSFMTDTFAYFSGYLFGRHKLIPSISPKKTIEGSIGGILGSTICCVAFGYVFNLGIAHMILVGSIGSVVAQLGDLFASAIKRYVGIKDYGKLIPGHGGILDRFDSVILVAPFVYYAIYIFI